MITINNQQYKTADLSEQAKAHLTHLRFIDAEIQRCQMSINVLAISRRAIGDLLRKDLPAALPKEAVAIEPVLTPEPKPAPVPVQAVAPESKGKAKPGNKRR